MPKMGFTEKLGIIFGGNPTKQVGIDEKKLEGYDVHSNNVVFVEPEPSKLMEAVMNNDMERLRFYAKHSMSKLTEKALSSALPLACSVEAVDLLISLGARPSKQAMATVANNVIRRLSPDSANSDVIKFFKANDISMCINDGVTYSKELKNGRTISYKKSLYDCARNKEDWFEEATKEEIEHEFRQAVANGDTDKASEMFKIGREKFDVNGANKFGTNAMCYALNIKNTEVSKEMALLLHNMRASLDYNGINAFERAEPEVQKALLLNCIEKGDLVGLTAAVNAGIPLNRTDYLLNAEHPATVRFLSKHGASIDDAMFELARADEGAYGSEENVNQFRLLKGVLEHNFRQAVADGDVKTVEKMLEKHKDTLIDSSNAQGFTAMIYAAQTNNIEMATLFYKNKADLSAETKAGKNVFDYASKDMFNALLKAAQAKGDSKALKAAGKASANAKNPDGAELMATYNAATSKIDR